MSQFAWHLFQIFVRLDGVGLLGLGVLDTMLFMPFGNDLLILALTARHHQRLFYYALMATAGSVIGCLILDTICRKGGEKGLEGRVPPKRLEYVRSRVKKRAGWALALASLAPPPFPFTVFIIVSSALHYPRKKLLTIVGVCRAIRFLAECALATVFGRHILALARTPVFQYVMLGFVVLCVVGSIVTVFQWAMKSKKVMVAGKSAGISPV